MEIVADRGNLLRLHVQNAARKTQCLFSQEATDQFIAETVLENTETDSFYSKVF